MRGKWGEVGGCLSTKADAGAYLQNQQIPNADWIYGKRKNLRTLWLVPVHRRHAEFFRLLDLLFRRWS